MSIFAMMMRIISLMPFTMAVQRLNRIQDHGKPSRHKTNTITNYSYLKTKNNGKFR